MNTPDLLARALMETIENPRPYPLPHPIAQADALRTLYASYVEPCEFKAGDVVIPKDNCQVMNDNPLLVLLRPLDPNAEIDWAIIRNWVENKYDDAPTWLALCVGRGGSEPGMAIFPVNVARFRPWTEPVG